MTALDDPALAARFWVKVDKAGPWSLLHRAPGRCWIWTAAKQKGYGVIGLGRRGAGLGAAHRLAYEDCHGTIPAGLDIDHLCRVPACVNPAHLEAVTHRVNILRGHTFAARLAASTECIHGHPFTDANTYRTQKGRHCKTCRRQRSREFEARKVAA